ncbi:hypothetical protein Y032_0575g190 [Ancylostoma ceylanicum]|uniref:Uncharacterized protein n=2 Tax=Ancylostoma ceylanicum TaxID=53326 RepID=A0A016WPP4_9BILA|nr:hypothetical protein Y032_0575g190 [Ancylostoma ceylanicum]
MTENYLDRPMQTHRTYKVCSHGPVEIYYIPDKELHPDNKFAFQIQSCWEPLMCSTATCYTRVICQSDVPVFIPATAHVWVEVKI